MIPLFGAYIADTKWGRYKTTCYSVAIVLVGHILLVISALPPVIEHRHGALACFIVAIIVMGAGQSMLPDTDWVSRADNVLRN